MNRFLLGLVVGFCLAAAAVGAGTPVVGKDHGPLSQYEGQGSRPGLYYASGVGRGSAPKIHFYECRYLGLGTFTPPAK